MNIELTGVQKRQTDKWMSSIQKHRLNLCNPTNTHASVSGMFSAALLLLTSHAVDFIFCLERNTYLDKGEHQ